VRAQAIATTAIRDGDSWVRDARRRYHQHRTSRSDGLVAVAAQKSEPTEKPRFQPVRGASDAPGSTVATASGRWGGGPWTPEGRIEFRNGCRARCDSHDRREGAGYGNPSNSALRLGSRSLRRGRECIATACLETGDGLCRQTGAAVRPDGYRPQQAIAHKMADVATGPADDGRRLTGSRASGTPRG